MEGDPFRSYVNQRATNESHLSSFSIASIAATVATTGIPTTAVTSPPPNTAAETTNGVATINAKFPKNPKNSPPRPLGLNHLWFSAPLAVRGWHISATSVSLELALVYE